MTRGTPCSFKCKQGLQGRKRQGRQIDGEKDERGAICSFKCKQGLQGRKCQGHQIDGEKDERGAMQFQVQAGAPGKKTSGAPNWRRKGREMRHAVSSASRGSREENVRGAKLTEKRTRGMPCSFKCIIMMLVSFTFLLYFTTPRQCRPWSYRGKKLVIPSWQMEKEVNAAPHHHHSPKGPGRPVATN